MLGSSILVYQILDGCELGGSKRDSDVRLRRGIILSRYLKWKRCTMALVKYVGIRTRDNNVH